MKGNGPGKGTLFMNGHIWEFEKDAVWFFVHPSMSSTFELQSEGHLRLTPVPTQIGRESPNIATGVQG